MKGSRWLPATRNPEFLDLQVFVTAQGRCLELARCLVQSRGLLLLVGPGSGKTLAARLEKYILYGDEVRDSDGNCLAQTVPGKHRCPFFVRKW